MRFHSNVIFSGNATTVEIPPYILKALASGPRPLIAITIKGHMWRSRVALIRGQCLIGISAANRSASGISEGELVEVDLELDTQPRLVPEPPDLAMTLNDETQARAAFDCLPYGLKRKHIVAIEEAKTPEVRQRRIAKLVLAMR